MTGYFLKSSFTLIIILGTCLLLSGQSRFQSTAIRNANIQIRATLQGAPLAWATDTVSIILDKQTGEFEAMILADDLHYAVSNPNFTPVTGENEGKYLTLKGIIPINEVIQNLNSTIDRKVDMTATFNDLEYHSTFTFTILTLQNNGFSVMANGPISHRALEIRNLEELEDELQILLSFTGY